MESDLLGYMSDAGRFTCANCASKELEDDDSQTPAFQSDEWFEPTLCNTCKLLIERNKEIP